MRLRSQENYNNYLKLIFLLQCCNLIMNFSNVSIFLKEYLIKLNYIYLSYTFIYVNRFIHEQKISPIPSNTF